MQPCDELKNLIVQLYKSEALGGLVDFARQLYSHQVGVMVIGSDLKDGYKDYEAIIRFYEAASAAVLDINVVELNAYRESTVGWVVDRVMARLPHGIEITVRHTYIFHQENEAWKIIHAHISIGVPDEVIAK